MLGTINLLAATPFVDTFQRTVVGDEVTFTKSAWLSIFHYVVLAALVLVLPFVLRSTWINPRLPRMARVGVLVTFGLMWAAASFALYACIACRNDRVTVTPKSTSSS